MVTQVIRRHAGAVGRESLIKLAADACVGLLGLALAALAAILLGCGAEVREALAQGWELREAGKIDSALMLADRLVRLAPDCGCVNEFAATVYRDAMKRAIRQRDWRAAEAARIKCESLARRVRYLFFTSWRAMALAETCTAGIVFVNRDPRRHSDPVHREKPGPGENSEMLAYQLVSDERNASSQPSGHEAGAEQGTLAEALDDKGLKRDALDHIRDDTSANPRGETPVVRTGAALPGLSDRERAPREDSGIPNGPQAPDARLRQSPIRNRRRPRRTLARVRQLRHGSWQGADNARDTGGIRRTFVDGVGRRPSAGRSGAPRRRREAGA